MIDCAHVNNHKHFFNTSTICPFARLFIGCIKIALMLYMYATNIYCMPLYNWTGKRTHRLVCIVPSFVSPRTVKQHVELSTAVHICSGRFVLSTARRTSTIYFFWILVDCTHCPVLTMCPLSVDVACRRYLLINLYVRPENDLSYRLPIDRRSAIFVGEHKLW